MTKEQNKGIRQDWHLVFISRPSREKKTKKQKSKKVMHRSPDSVPRFGVLAWGTFAWFVTEPDNIVIYREETVKHGKMLYELI
jgi:hypothetical protein